MTHAKLPESAHTSHPWRIHELTGDFRIEDVWALPTPGGRADDFHLLVEGLASGDPAQQSPSRAARALWAIRWKLGEWFGWDEEDAGLGSRVPSLLDRLPPDLREASGPEFDALPFTSLYLLEDEWAAEIANKTVHGVMHMGWVPDGSGGYRGQMAVLVKPNGRFGRAYMAAIRPFRHLIVYPPMLREIGRLWRDRDDPLGDVSAAGVTPTTVEALLESARRELERMSPATAQAAHGRGATLVDIRTETQRGRDGEIPGAVVISRNVLEWRLDPACPDRDPELAKPGDTVIVICNEGYQSSLAAATLRRFGLDATDVIGGAQAWRTAGLPLI